MSFRFAFLILLLMPCWQACTSNTALAAGSDRATGDHRDRDQDPATIRYEDHVYSPTVRTVQLFKAGFEMTPPMIELGGQDRLLLRFDDIDSRPMNLSYTVVHCDAQWRPSDLAKGEYLQGAFQDYLQPGRQSFNTLQPFIQYELELPNQFVRITRSGNYLLKVYHGNDEEDLVLTRRFMIFEHRVQIGARMQASRNVELRDTHQQINFTISHPGLRIPDPFGDLQVVMLQNMNWHDARHGFKPRFVRNDELVYDHLDLALFTGGNEFRNFDLKDLRFQTLRVAAIRYGRELMEAILVREPKRSFSVYLDLPDINGRYLVRNDDANGDPLGADYVNVWFQLAMTEQLHDGDVYVVGGFSGMACDPRYRMQWDAERSQYALIAPLKQGFYDYVFAYRPNNTDQCDLSYLEGTHFATENDYLILVYFNDFQQRHDRLVGVRFLNTRRD